MGKIYAVWLPTLIEWFSDQAATPATGRKVFSKTAEPLRALWITPLRTIIVDEWHELLGTKRGVQTELCLARLRAWCPRLKTWGLSATLGNLEEALSVLVGRASPLFSVGNHASCGSELLWTARPRSPSPTH